MTTTKKITKQDVNGYNHYLDDALPCIEELKKYMGPKGEMLDFSQRSLKTVDEFLKDVRVKIKYYKEDGRLTKDEKWLIVRLAYYLAQVVITKEKAIHLLDELY